MLVTVTGATGNLGHACVTTLLRTGHQVRAFVRRPDEFRRRCPDFRVQVAVGDILDRAATGSGLEGSDAVVHCIDFSPRRYGQHWDALRHALEGAGPGRQLIIPGNAWVFAPSSERVGPDHPKRSPSVLGALRADMDRAVLAEGGTVVHLPEVYGPHVRKGAAQVLIRNAVAGKSLRFAGDLDRPREFLYVEDAARALVAPLAQRRARHACFAANATGPISVRQFAALIFRTLGRSRSLHSTSALRQRLGLLFSGERRALFDLEYLNASPLLFDGSRLRRELGWRPEVDYPDGIRRTVRWLQAYTAESA